MTEDEFRDHVSAMVEQTCGSTAALARKHKLHPKALTLFLSGARGPSPEVARSFGFERRYAALATDATDGATGGGEVISRALLKVKLDALVSAASNEWGAGSTEHNLVRDITDALNAVPAITATTPGGDLLEQAARLVEEGYRCRSCDAVFINQPSDIIHGGHPDNGCTRPNWDKLEEESLVAAIRALSARNQTDDGGEA